jgi:hypothetical protein
LKNHGEKSIWEGYSKVDGDGSIGCFGGWIVMRRKQQPEVSTKKMEILERMTLSLGEVNDFLERTYDKADEDDSYTVLLNLIHARIPDTFMLEQLIRDAGDSEMRCPK